MVLARGALRRPAHWWTAPLALLLLTAHAAAHKGEKHGTKPASSAHAEASKPITAPAAAPNFAAEAQEVQQSQRTGFFSRLADWLGRLHPIVVHFPMAFLPAALFTAVVGRRRPSFAAPVQFLVVAGGVLAVVSTVLGWLNAGAPSAADDWLLQGHRWLGTGIGAGSLGLAAWAALRPEQDRSMLMIIGLSIITAAIVVQGWFGGALVHGADHLNW